MITFDKEAFDMELSENQTFRWLQRFKEWMFSEKAKLTQDEILYLKAFVAQRQRGKTIDNVSRLRDESA